LVQRPISLRGVKVLARALICVLWAIRGLSQALAP